MFKLIIGGLIGGAIGAGGMYLFFRVNDNAEAQIEEARKRTATFLQDYGWSKKEAEEMADELHNENTPSKD